MTLLELFKADERIAIVMRAIMLSSSRLRYKRDEMRKQLRIILPQYIDFPMSELRELQYFLHPEDARRMTRCPNNKGAI